ncbi:hypothetical protein BOX15_Mlig003157g1 [Macrostomum lignano]|uniref:Ribosome assembly factor mrt4 n=2 Tax=Macrostomum lignano TaxID=282301 RepID=A0A1I8FZU4_9PLAT|nr:hypothetical protein BOX15_Mlig003157g3 [Macrostomum lignano]PAA69176.1 hypothetical protein BOX15_Mlig003157g1 [Macrostomum lignano]
MPKSKRDRPVPLTKTKKRRSQDVKSQLMERVRDLVNSYDRILVLCIDNMRSSKLQMLRAELKDSKLLLGKNRLIAKALGLTPGDELQPNLHRLSRLLRNQKALLFTNRSLAAVSELLAGLTDADFARSGFAAVNSVELMPGACPQWQHSMEPALRKLGLPVRLVKGVIHLERPHLVCRRGRRLTPEQCEVLKLCQYQMAEFRVRPVACWDKAAGGRLTDDLLSETAAKAAAEAPGRVRLTSTVLDDGLSYFVPELLDDDPDDGGSSDDDAEMASGDEEVDDDEEA